MKTSDIIAYIDTTFDEFSENIRDYIICLETENYEEIWSHHLAFEYTLDRFEMYIRALRDKLENE